MSQWSELVGQWFYFVGGPGGFAAYQVREVKPLSANGVRPPELARRQAFAVTFQTWNLTRTNPGNAMVEIAHDKFPALPIFVGSAFRLGDKSMLVAVFN